VEDLDKTEWEYRLACSVKLNRNEMEIAMRVYPNLRLLIVGMNSPADQAQFMSHIKNLEARGIEWRDGCLAVPSFYRALGMLAGCMRLEVVHVHKGDSYASLARDCKVIARALAVHVNSPHLNLNGIGFNFLRSELRGYPHVRIGTLEDAADERWTLSRQNRCIEESF